MSKLYVIGNGFDLSHDLPTNFKTDFKVISEKNEINPLFWELYQSHNPEIWADFENLLAVPDFNSLEEIFEDYTPDYSSEHEYDRDAIITEAESSGNLQESLLAFVSNAENNLLSKSPKKTYLRMFQSDDIFVNFNYTHTLETLYGVDEKNILHIHGEMGKNNLVMGYPGNFLPEIYTFDPTMKRGFKVRKDILKYVQNIEDYYISEAYRVLYEKVKGFKKEYNIDILEQFLKKRNYSSVVVIGHSYKIDFPYFEFINDKQNTKWELSWYSPEDEDAAKNLTEKIGISYYKLTKI